MKYNDYNGGKFSTGYGGKNRFTTSAVIDDARTSAIAIIASILVLAILTGVVFVMFRDDFAFPTWEDVMSDITSTTTKPKPVVGDPPTNYPYATKTDKTQFVANKGGEGLGYLGLNSEYAILIRVDDMATLGYKYADEKIYPASMTKVMTVITALDYIENLDDIYIFDPEIVSSLVNGESTADMKYIYDEYGITKYTVRDILYGISYRSGADAVLCLMDYLGFTMTEFVELMNEKAIAIGLTKTYFGGAIGMNDEENQTTCREMAAIMAYAMENEYAREFFSGQRYYFDLYDGFSYYNRTFQNTIIDSMKTTVGNLLGSNYNWIATKSGYDIIRDDDTGAGYCLVSYLEGKDGSRYVVVTAKAKRYTDDKIYAPSANPVYDLAKIFNSLKP